MSRYEEQSFEDSPDDAKIAAILRDIAHAPPCLPMGIGPGTVWGGAGRYVIEGCIGRGGMGVVYVARDSLLSRPVALKLLDVDADAEPEGPRRRLLREARLAAQVEHNHIARVYDVGEYDGVAFVAMEFVRGVTLRQRAAQRALSAGEILSFGRQIAEGLAELHQAGVFHRDLKPDNVMIAEKDTVKLLDFGLARELTARRLGEGVDAGGGALSTFSGTPGYMAPEQYEGAMLDARVDVFAFGVMLFELVTGDRPFGSKRLPSEMRSAMKQPPDFGGGAWHDVPPALRAIIARCLAFEPAERFASGVELLEALQKVSPKRPLALPRSRFGQMGLMLALLASTFTTSFLIRVNLKPPKSVPGMVPIDVGTIAVGRSLADIDRECRAIGPGCDREIMLREVPEAKVKVAPFLIDVDEVTNGELAAWLSTISSMLHVKPDPDTQTLRYVGWGAQDGHGDEVLIDLDETPMLGVEYTSERSFRARPGRERLPAVQVTWHGARAFCAFRGKRLPTENEWEAAARGKQNRPLPWGAAPARCGGVVVPADGQILMEAGCPTATALAPVGEAAQDITAERVRGLAGNASEWVDATYVEGDRQAQVEASRAADLPKVIRGGSFAVSLSARTTGRHRRPASAVGANIGFRCASDG